MSNANTIWHIEHINSNAGTLRTIYQSRRAAVEGGLRQYKYAHLTGSEFVDHSGVVAKLVKGHPSELPGMVFVGCC